MQPPRQADHTAWPIRSDGLRTPPPLWSASRYPALSVEALVCKLGGSRLSRWPAGEPSGHGDRHRPVHDGFVVPGQAFVVADGAAAPGDPGQGSLDDPAAGRTWKVCRLSGRLTIWSVNLGLSVVLAQV